MARHGARDQITPNLPVQRSRTRTLGGLDAFKASTNLSSATSASLSNTFTIIDVYSTPDLFSKASSADSSQLWAADGRRVKCVPSRLLVLSRYSHSRLIFFALPAGGQLVSCGQVFRAYYDDEQAMTLREIIPIQRTSPARFPDIQYHLGPCADDGHHGLPSNTRHRRSCIVFLPLTKTFVTTFSFTMTGLLCTVWNC